MIWLPSATLYCRLLTGTPCHSTIYCHIRGQCDRRQALTWALESPPIIAGLGWANIWIKITAHSLLPTMPNSMTLDGTFERKINLGASPKRTFRSNVNVTL